MSVKETRRRKGEAIWEQLADNVCKYSNSILANGAR
jgi:hypothetical protein